MTTPLNPPSCDIATYAWLHVDTLGSPSADAHCLSLFRDEVVRPSLRALETELSRLQASDEPRDVFLHDAFADLFQSTVAGYLLAVQSMWERGLRRLLIERDARLLKGANRKMIEKAKWGEKKSGIEVHVERLLGMPIQAFDSFADLDLLQNLGNAVRHGDGDAAKKVHKLCPTLWTHWFPPGTTFRAGPFEITVPAHAAASPSFESVTLTQALLERSVQSVLWFWDDLEGVRLNSIRSPSPGVVQKLVEWKMERASRRCGRGEVGGRVA